MKNTELVNVIEAAKAGSNEAFSEIIRRYRACTYNAALKKTRCPLTAEEIAQDTFISVWKGIGSFEYVSDASFGGWVSLVAYRTLVSNLRKRKEEIASEDALSSVSDREEQEIDTTAQDNVRDGIAGLEDFDRQTLEDFYLRGKKIKQIASETGAPVGTIKRRLSVARNRLKAKLENKSQREEVAA